MTPRRLALLVPAPLLLLPLLTGCADPCKGLTASPAMREAVAQGVEVEVDRASGDCELRPDGTWQYDADKRKTTTRTRRT